MIIHELATNSVKPGALSCEQGVLQVRTTVEDNDLELIWAETGGTSLRTVPKLTGYGGKMVELSVAHQLAGTIRYDWQPSGLVAKLKMRKDRLAL